MCGNEDDRWAKEKKSGLDDNKDGSLMYYEAEVGKEGTKEEVVRVAFSTPSPQYGIRFLLSIVVHSLG